MIDLKLGRLITGWRVEDGLLCCSRPLLFYKHTGEECHNNKVYFGSSWKGERETCSLFIILFRKFKKIKRVLNPFFSPLWILKEKKHQNASLWKYLLWPDAVFLTYVTYFYGIRSSRSWVVSKMFDLDAWVWPKLIIGVFSAKRN